MGLTRSIVNNLVPILFLSCAGGRASLYADTNRGAQPHDSIVSEFATEFLRDVCAKADGKAFSEAWLQHEAKHWDFYEPTYYRTPNAKAARAGLAGEMAGRRIEMCKYVRTFLIAAPAIIASVRPKVAELTGEQPNLPLYFASALQWTDGNGSTYKGQRVYVFNARHDTYTRTTGMVATIIHELVHSAFASRDSQTLSAATPTLSEALYHEGVAVYVTQIMLPEVGIGATGLKPEELDAAEKVERIVAKDFLRLWDQENAEEAHQKYFSGGWSGKEHPRKMGYFLGLKIFRQLEKDIGSEAAIRILPADFRVRAKVVLQKIALERPTP